MNTRVRIIVIVTVVAACAAVAGLYFTGIIGGSGGSGGGAKLAVEPVRLADPFIVNLADTATVHYVKLGLAVRVADMTAADRTKFVGPPGAAGSGEITGEIRLATYPPMRDAVIETVSTFTADQLNSVDGKSQLKAELLRAFATVEAKDRHGVPASHDPALPPYKITDVLFTDFAVQ